MLDGDGPKKAVIVGGGIAGLSAALCLSRIGWDVSVLEAAPRLEEAGAGIQLAPNATRILDALGLGALLERSGTSVGQTMLRAGRSGRVLARLPMGVTALRRWGAPYIHIHRADLVALLAEALESARPGVLRLGAHVQACRQDSHAASAILDDGSEVSGAVLIGADGAASLVRKCILGAGLLRNTGDIARRCLIPASALGEMAPPDAACVWTGPGCHCVTYRIRKGTLCTLVAVCEEDAPMMVPGAWHERISAMLARAGDMRTWPLAETAPLSRWSSGRIGLAGDACHAMLPYLAQGAGQAIEDGWVLAFALGGTGPLSERLKRFHRLRCERIAQVRAGVRINRMLFHVRSPAMRAVAHTPLRLAGLAGLVGLAGNRARLHSLDWLYGHDVVSICPLVPRRYEQT